LSIADCIADCRLLIALQIADWGAPILNHQSIRQSPIINPIVNRQSNRHSGIFNPVNLQSSIGNL
jgi:hypothetical protein